MEHELSPADAEKRDVISAALSAKREGDSSKYNALVAQLRRNNDPMELRSLFVALTYCVSSIDVVQSEDLIATTLSNKAWYRDEELAKSFLTFMCHLVSANGVYIEMCIRVIVERMLPPPPRDDGEDDEDKPPYVDVTPLLHETVRQLLSIFPASSACLCTVVRELMPHKRMAHHTHQHFLSHVLHILSYAPELQELLLREIILTCIALDVEIDTTIRAAAAAADEDDDAEEQFELDDINGADTSLPEPEESVDHETEMDRCVAKLDCIMEQLFAYIDSKQTKEEEAHAVFESLQRIFFSVVLTTHRTKYVQYLMFYACSIGADGEEAVFAKSFVERLLKWLLDGSRPMNTRLVCAAYLGGFVGRAKFLPIHQIQVVLQELTAWAHKYIDTVDKEVTYPDAERHWLFYSVCQAIFYIVCFRCKQILAEHTNGHAVMRGLDMRRITCARLNPLKLSLSSVAQIFTQVTRENKILDCSEVMENNASLSLPTVTVWGGPNRLEGFFPFDPFTLPLSNKYVDDLYVQWDAPDEDEYETDSDSFTATPTDSSIGSSFLGGSMGGAAGFMLASSVERMLVSPGVPGGSFMHHAGSLNSRSAQLFTN